MRFAEIDIFDSEGFTQSEVKRYCRACGWYGMAVQEGDRLLCGKCSAAITD